MSGCAWEKCGLGRDAYRHLRHDPGFGKDWCYETGCHPFTHDEELIRRADAWPRLRAALEDLLDSIDYCHGTRHLGHADQLPGTGMAGADCDCGVNWALSAARAALTSEEDR